MGQNQSPLAHFLKHKRQKDVINIYNRIIIISFVSDDQGDWSLILREKRSITEVNPKVWTD